MAGAEIVHTSSEDTADLDVTIILPVYNEAEHLEAEVDRVKASMNASGLSYEIIIVDDGSKDGSGDIAATIDGVRLIRFAQNRGSGSARKAGTAAARGRVTVWTDVDMTYPNDQIPELVKELEGYDQVVGARTSEEGTMKALRVPAKWFIRKLAEVLTNSAIPDLNSGLRAFRREVALPYLRLLPPGFSCVTTITIAFLSNQHDVKYVPIEYAKRAGKSKFKFVKDAYRYILQVLRMVMYFNPLKVLMPLALFLVGLGIAKGIYDMVVHLFYFAINTILILVSGLIIATLALLADLIVRSRGDV